MTTLKCSTRTADDVRMGVPRHLLTAVAMVGAALAGQRTRRTKRQPETAIRPRARTVCTASSVVVSTAARTAATHAATPTRVALRAITSAGASA